MLCVAVNIMLWRLLPLLLSSEAEVLHQIVGAEILPERSLLTDLLGLGNRLRLVKIGKSTVKSDAVTLVGGVKIAKLTYDSRLGRRNEHLRCRLGSKHRIYAYRLGVDGGSFFARGQRRRSHSRSRLVFWSVIALVARKDTPYAELRLAEGKAQQSKRHDDRKSGSEGAAEDG